MYLIAFLVCLGALMLALITSALWRGKDRRPVSVAICITWTLIVLVLLLIWGLNITAGAFAFAQPAWLLLLLLPVSVWAFHLYYGHWFRPPLALPGTDELAPLTTLRETLTGKLPLLLVIAGLCLLVCALARPVSVRSAKLPPTQGIDIMMIIDTSQSMNNQDFYPSRFAAAKKTAENFISKRFNDRIGLTIFAKNASLAAPLTLDHEALQELVDSLFIGMVDPTLTAIGDALGVASSHFKDSLAKSKVILLLTDGSNNAGTLDPLLAAKAAAAYGIKVYTIATASPPGTTIFSSTEEEIDEGLLMEIAKTTGGVFYRAKNETELQQIYDHINKLEKTEFAPTVLTSQNDVYTPWLIVALCLIGLGLVLRKFIFIQVP